MGKQGYGMGTLENVKCGIKTTTINWGQTKIQNRGAGS